MQSKRVTFECKIPHHRIKIISFLREPDVKVIRKNIRYFIKTFKTAVVINNCFGATEIGTEGEAHSVGIYVCYKWVFYDLNFGAFGTFSPLNILSAPTFFPLLG